jgi:hypothetical protein
LHFAKVHRLNRLRWTPTIHRGVHRSTTVERFKMRCIKPLEADLIL